MAQIFLLDYPVGEKLYCGVSLSAVSMATGFTAWWELNVCNDISLIFAGFKGESYELFNSKACRENPEESKLQSDLKYGS